MDPSQTTPFTIGVEEEYQLVDPVTGALRDHASALRRDDWTGELVAELQETTVEVVTPVCTSAADAQAQLERLRFQASTVAAAHGVAIAAAGLHPFTDWHGHVRPQLERYQDIEERYGRIAADEHIFGMHIHVAVPDHVDRLAIINVVRHYLPHLLALSASSPFFEGADTGFASYRTILWRRWPSSGVPPRFESQSEYRHYVDALLDAGVIKDPWNLYWSLRQHSTYPTIEFRVTDVCPSLDDAIAIAALARAIVCAAVNGTLVDDAPCHLSTTLEHELVRANEWRAARDGLDARVIDTATGTRNEPMRSAVRRLLDTVGRVAEDAGDAHELAHIETVLARGNGADAMRRVYRDDNSLQSIVEWLVRETLAGTGLDRRARQQAGP